MEEKDVRYFKITDYDKENAIDKLFIQQEVLYQKHKLICERIENAPQDTNLVRSLTKEKNRIEKDAKENADKIINLNEDARIRRKIEEEELQKKAPPNTNYVKTKRR